MWNRISGSCWAVLLGVTTLGAQDTRFAEEQTVVAVEVPVQVLVDGRPVRGLTASDFEVVEGRKVHSITGFEVVDLTVARTDTDRPAGVSRIGPSGRRYFLLLFDLTNATPAALLRARLAAHELVRERLHPADLVAVATWSFTKGPRLLLSFTTDRRQIEAALATLGVVDVRNPTPDPLGLLLAESSGPPLLPGGAGAGGGRGQFEEVAREALEQAAAQERAAVRQARRSELDSFAQGLEALASAVRRIEARKHVVLLSLGPDPQTIVGRAGEAGYDESAASAVASGQIWNVNSEERFGDAGAANRFEALLGELRRANCTVQAVDLGGLVAAQDQGFRRASGRETLHALARDTGGQLFENFNDLGEAFSKVLESTSVTYVLTIQPQNLKFDGRYRELKVRLKKEVPGARIVHRPGYFAPLPPGKEPPGERRVDLAALLVAGKPGGSLPGGLAWVALPTPAGDWHVPVVYELRPGLGLPKGAKGKLPLSFFLYAFDRDGQVRDHVAQSLELDLAQLGSKVREEPLRFVADLRLPSGSYVLRALAAAGVGERTWLEVRELELADPIAGELRLLGVVQPAEFQAGIVIRSALSAQRTQGLPFPFVRGESFYLPRGGLLLSPGTPMRLVALVSGLAGDGVEVRARWLDAEGRELAPATVRLLERRAGEPVAGVERFELEVDPAPQGALELEVEFQAGLGRSVRRRVPVG